MSVEQYRDRTLTCRDCGQDFTFRAGEQEFYASRGLTNDPGRCPTCRAARRSGQSVGPRMRGEQYETTCASCGKQTTVPFVPREGRPVYCRDCFQPQRTSHSRRSDSYSSRDGTSQGWSRDQRDRRKGRW